MERVDIRERRLLRIIEILHDEGEELATCMCMGGGGGEGACSGILSPLRLRQVRGRRARSSKYLAGHVPSENDGHTVATYIESGKKKKECMMEIIHRIKSKTEGREKGCRWRVKKSNPPRRKEP